MKVLLEIWWDENDAYAHNTGWKVLANGDLFEGSNRSEVILEATSF